MDFDLVGKIVELSNSIDWPIFTGVCGALLAVTVAVKALKPSKKRNYLKRQQSAVAKHSSNSVRTEDVEREYGNLTVQTASLDYDQLYFAGGSKKPKVEHTTFDKDRPNSILPRSSQLIEEAIVFDSFGRKTNACECLKKAILKTEDIPEKNRLQHILNKYMESSDTNILEALTLKFPAEQEYDKKI